MTRTPPITGDELKPLEERMEEERAKLTTARDNLRLQLNGIENQLYIIDHLLNPPPIIDTPSPPADDTTRL